MGEERKPRNQWKESSCWGNKRKSPRRHRVGRNSPPQKKKQTCQIPTSTPPCLLRRASSSSSTTLISSRLSSHPPRDDQTTCSIQKVGSASRRCPAKPALTPRMPKGRSSCPSEYRPCGSMSAGATCATCQHDACPPPPHRLPTWDQVSPCQILRTPPSVPDSGQHRHRGVATVGSDMSVEQHKRRANLGRSAGSDLPREISS